MQELISIVIPTYNRARDLERALKSVIEQTYTHWEVLVVDNHSTDDTNEIVNSCCDKRIRLLKINNDGVIAASRNLGVKNANGNYIAFLDSDDWWCPSKLEKSIEQLVAGADLVYHDMYLVKKPEQKHFFLNKRQLDLTNPVFDNLILIGNTIPNSSVVIRKSLLEVIGGISEDVNLVAIEDFDTWLRVAKITEKFTRIPEFLGYYWAGGGNTSNPEGSLLTINVFEERYANELVKIKNGGALWWTNFIKGRAYYQLGDLENAKSALRSITLKSAPLSVMLKIIWMQLLSIDKFSRNATQQ